MAGGLLLLLLLVASLYLLVSVRERRVRHTDEARVALLKLESLVVDAEAGARGYAASGNRIFLQPYTISVANRRAVFEAAQALTMNDGAQRWRLDAIAPVIEREFEILQSLIDAHSRGAAGEELVPQLALGKQIMDDIRARVADMLHEEEALDLKDVRSESTKIGATFGALLMAVALLVAGARWFAKVRRLERQVFERERQTREQAENASKLAELFVAVLGHDLRNPLGAIKTSASQLARNAPGEREQRIATRILTSGERLARMIDRILDFSRIRTGHGLLQKPAPMDLCELIGRVGEELTNGTSIQVDTEGATGVVWDRDRLAQVFSNLLGNAVEHAPEKGTVRVSVDGRASDRVEVRVQNPGVIPADVMPQVFEPFRRAPQEKSRGLGLGLYISKEIVAAHGGTIMVTSSESVGTRFTVRLPRSAPASVDDRVKAHFSARAPGRAAEPCLVLLLRHFSSCAHSHGGSCRPLSGSCSSPASTHRKRRKSPPVRRVRSRARAWLAAQNATLTAIAARSRASTAIALSPRFAGVIALPCEALLTRKPGFRADLMRPGDAAAEGCRLRAKSTRVLWSKVRGMG